MISYSVKDTCQWFLLCPIVNLAKCGQTFDKVVNYPAELLRDFHSNILVFPTRSRKNLVKTLCTYYSRVHKRWQSFFSKILKKPSIVQKKMIPHIKGLDFSPIWSKKKFKMADLENSKWPPQKTLVFQLRQFSIFFHEISMVWSLG